MEVLKSELNTGTPNSHLESSSILLNSVVNILNLMLQIIVVNFKCSIWNCVILWSRIPLLLCSNCGAAPRSYRLL